MFEKGAACRGHEKRQHTHVNLATLAHMAMLADIRCAALALPGASETAYGGARFGVGKKAFVHYWAKEDGYVFKLPRARMDMLFEVQPDVFRPYRSGAMLWSWVEVGKLTRGEAAALVTEAWTTIVPRSVSAPYLAAQKA